MFSLQAPCCSKIYQCRICHDETEGHKLDRSKVEKIVCLQCDTKQKVVSVSKLASRLWTKYYDDDNVMTILF